MTWTVEDALEQVHNELKELHVEFPLVNTNFSEETDDQLREHLAKFGAWQGYIELQLAYVDSERGAITTTLDNAVARRMGVLPTTEGRQLKEVQRARVIEGNEQLKELQRRVIEVNAKYTALSHIRDGLEILWRTVSRILSSRGYELQKLGS